MVHFFNSKRTVLPIFWNRSTCASRLFSLKQLVQPLLRDSLGWSCVSPWFCRLSSTLFDMLVWLPSLWLHPMMKGVLFAAASSISYDSWCLKRLQTTHPALSLCKTQIRVLFRNAMLPTAALFSVVLISSAPRRTANHWYVGCWWGKTMCTLSGAAGVSWHSPFRRMGKSLWWCPREHLEGRWHRKSSGAFPSWKLPGFVCPWSFNGGEDGRGYGMMIPARRFIISNLWNPFGKKKDEFSKLLSAVSFLPKRFSKTCEGDRVNMEPWSKTSKGT